MIFKGIGLILTREPEASFKVVADIFITTFKRKDYLGEKLGERLGERWSEKWSGLNINQRKLLSLMVDNPTISRKELSEKLNINQSAIQKHIEKLKKKGILRRVGPAKGGYWEIIK